MEKTYDLQKKPVSTAVIINKLTFKINYYIVIIKQKKSRLYLYFPQQIINHTDIQTWSERFYTKEPTKKIKKRYKLFRN